MLRARLKYREDAYLSYHVENFVANAHGLVDITVMRHKVINGLECDAVMYGSTEGGKIRTIGFELKQNDVNKVIDQAIARRKFFHYMYIVTPLPLTYFIHIAHNSGKLYEMLRHGIGLIIVDDDERGSFVPTKAFIRSKFYRRPEWAPPKPLDKVVEEILGK